jgi:hypothetical protein
MKVIDFRVRPAYGSYAGYFKDSEFLTAYANQLGFDPAESALNGSVDLLLKEMEESNVEHAVVTGRQKLGVGSEQKVANEELSELSDKYNDKFYAFPFISAVDVEKSISEIDKYVIHGNGKGVIIENGNQDNPYDVNDKRAYPVYKYLEENHVPLLITYEPLTIPLVDSKTVYNLNVLAKDFPNLHIGVVHGGWPWTKELIATAYKFPNVYLIPALYGTNVPGAEDYITAANGLIQNQVIYASAYPWLPIKGTIDYYKNESGLKESQFEKFFYNNAIRFLEEY